METERNAFVSSLAKFTVLNNTREMRSKNIQCIKTLINIADTDGNFLQDSWIHVLRCISQLDRMHLIGGGGRNVDSSFSAGEASLAPNDPYAAWCTHTHTHAHTQHTHTHNVSDVSCDPPGGASRV